MVAHISHASCLKPNVSAVAEIGNAVMLGACHGRLAICFSSGPAAE
jgi:hypothetical protein